MGHPMKPRFLPLLVAFLLISIEVNAGVSRVTGKCYAGTSMDNMSKAMSFQRNDDKDAFSKMFVLGRVVGFENSGWPRCLALREPG